MFDLKEFKWELTIACLLMLIFGFEIVPIRVESALGFIIISLLIMRRLYITRRTALTENPFEEFRWELTVAIIVLLFFSIGLTLDHPVYGFGLLVIALLLARRIRFFHRKKKE